jgi:hypothetical protein
MTGLVVCTAVTGRFNNKIRPPLYTPADDRHVNFVCFSDFLGSVPSPWCLLPPVWEHEDPRRTARYHKVMMHKLFPKASYWLWMDGNQQLIVDPWQLVDRYMDMSADIATYKHPTRKCVYEELDACLKLRKDNAALMRSQVLSYRQAGYPANNGMCETTVMIRRNTKAVRDFNEQWWREIVRGSVRDQLSFNYTMRKMTMVYKAMAGRRDKPKYFKYFSHR